MLHIIWGPPCAGKTTHINTHMQDTDIRVDLDAICQALGSPHVGHHQPTLIVKDLARAVRAYAIDQALRATTYTDVWIIDSTAHGRQLDAWEAQGARIHRIWADYATCMSRADTEQRVRAVNEWFAAYEKEKHGG